MTKDEMIRWLRGIYSRRDIDAEKAVQCGKRDEFEDAEIDKETALAIVRELEREK